MRRRLFNVVTALSLLLCVAAAALWLRSYAHADIIRAGKAWGVYRELVSDSGHVTVFWVRGCSRDRAWRHVVGPAGGGHDRRADASLLSVDANSVTTSTRIGPAYVWEGAGGMFDRVNSHGFYFADRVTFDAVTVAWWLPVVITALPPAAWLALRRASRRLPGFCPTCGYDLRATPGRCPECGTPTTTTPA